MKQMIAAGLTVLLMPWAAQAADWRLITLLDTDETAYFIDKASIKRNGDIATAWVMVANGAAIVVARSKINSTMIDCKRDLFRLLSTYEYGDSGQVVGSEVTATSVVQIIPGSVMEGLSKPICGKEKFQPDVYLDPVKVTKMFFEQRREQAAAVDSQ